MIKTTMAEAVRERPRGTKTKPKKNKEKTHKPDDSAHTAVQSVPPDSQQNVSSSLHSVDLSTEQAGPTRCTEEQAELGEGADNSETSCLGVLTSEENEGVSDSNALLSKDLEVDGNDITTLDLGIAAVHIRDAQSLPEQKDECEGVSTLVSSSSYMQTAEPEAAEESDKTGFIQGVSEVDTAHGEGNHAHSGTVQCSDELIAQHSVTSALQSNVHSQSENHILQKDNNCLIKPPTAPHSSTAEHDDVECAIGVPDGEARLSPQPSVVPEDLQVDPVLTLSEPHAATGLLPLLEAPSPLAEAATAPLQSLEPPSHLAEQVISPPSDLPIVSQDSAPSVLPLHATPLPTAPAAAVTSPSTESRVPVSPHHLYPHMPELGSPVEGKFQPMSLEQLHHLYYNPELQINSQFVEDFVKNEEKKTSHEFCDIVMNYCRSRKSLLSVEEDLKLLKQNLEQQQLELWISHKQNVSVEGQCADGSRVTKVYVYEQCQLNQDALSNTATTLQSIRTEMQGDLALFAYSSQMSRLQVESYLHLLFMDCPHMRSLPKDAPVLAIDRTREELAPEVHKVKECISVLFDFHRRPSKDEEFIANTRKWTEQLVAALLRVASYSDHLFLLNHLMRAPAGVGKWASGFIQVPGPASLAIQTTLGSPVLDHAVTCLATVLLPVIAREKFMCHMRANVSEQSIQMEQAWTLVDSDGEEDEDPSQAWLYLHENDVVSILQQFPLDTIFAHLLQAPVDESGTVHYDVRRCTEPTMMKLFAFCTTWISLLGQGLNTYSMARYRQLNKRLGRLIRQTIAFVSDHWLNFKTYYGPLASTVSLDHLQLEFDQLFMRATYTILTAQKLGSWQFMADMPFTCLSAGSVWRLLWLLQQGQGQPIDLHTLPPVEKCKEDMKDIKSRQELADALQTLPTSESIFLLTTFANMAASRPLEEDDFIECITLQVFEVNGMRLSDLMSESGSTASSAAITAPGSKSSSFSVLSNPSNCQEMIAYICDHTRDFCSKTGRELLSSIIQKHPTALSMLLRRVQGVMTELGKMSLYLFSELPASIWIPQDPDMLLLRQWLLNKDLTTPENQLACVVLDRMNWDLFAETGKLVLDIRLHRQVALLLVESYMKYIADRRTSFFIVEGMKQMASYAYSALSREQQFSNWVWSIALRLKLHRQAAILHSRAAEHHPFQPPSLEHDQWLLPLASAARAKNPLACFLVLSATDVGHVTSQFISEGLDMLMTLTMSSQFTAVIHILSCITPQFLTTPQYLLENETFHKILQMVLAADESVLKTTKMAMGAEFKAGTITQQFTQMIQAVVSAGLENSQALPSLLFWVQAIFKVAHFLTDQNCCYVLDHVVRWGYLLKGARDKLDALFMHHFKQVCKGQKSGLFNWVGGSSSQTPSLMDRVSMPEFGWLATQILNVEDANCLSCGVWPALQQELLSSTTASVDAALKTVVSRIKPSHAYSVGRLSIYRWAQQALDMPINHPMMPLVWQRFFSLFLGRCTQQAQMPTRASVGERFFQSMLMSPMLKRMKKKLVEASELHLKYDPQDDECKTEATSPVGQMGSPTRGGSETDSPLPSPMSEESPQYFSSKDFHNQLAKLYQTFSLWLEEPRLHGAELYLPALPPQYEAPRLMHIFTPSNSPWLEFVDFDGAQYKISLSAAHWRKVVSGRLQFGSHSPSHRRLTMRNERTATERIKQRLQQYKNPVQPPPLQPVLPPVPDISPVLLFDKTAAIHLLDADLSVLTEFTKFFTTRSAQHCAIDVAFLDLIPEQFQNVPKQAKVMAECRSRVNPLHRCAGPAVISVRIEEQERNSVVQRKIDENRAEYKQLVIEAILPPPQNICISTVHVENAITLLIKLSQSTSDVAKRSALHDVACTLFFHLTAQVSEETNFYPPTKQFFASCVEILGQEFVSRSPSQTPLLMQFCLEHPGLAGMVSPHFTPNNAPHNFVNMYEQLITVLQQQNLSLVFMLLTKFDVWTWLQETQPTAADKKRFLEILGSALMSCGAEPTADSKLVFDLYLKHLRCVLGHQFPSNLSCVLSLLLQGSSSDELHTSCWEMLLMECCVSLPEDQTSAKPFNPQLVIDCNTMLLSTEQLQELINWLGVFFNHQRRTQLDMLSFGLYPRWGRYVPYLALLMGLLARSFVAKVLVGLVEHNPFQAIQVVWLQQLDLWQAWMEPIPPTASPPTVAAQVAGAHELMQPWSDSDSTVALTMVESFKSTLLFTHATLGSTAPQLSNTVFSLLLMHYLTKLSHRSTPPHISDVLVGEFSQLPWEQLKPDLQLLETMAQLKEHCATTCFHLIGHVMPKVAWQEVMTAFKAHQDPQVARRLQACLLLLLVQCYGDIFVRELPEVVQLLTSAEMFDWSGLTVDAYRTTAFWFQQVCQPPWVLAQRSSLPALGFRLMKAAAGFSPTMCQAWTAEMSVKRLTYVHCITQTLCQVTFQPNADLEAASTVLVNLLSEIESVETAVADVRCQEEESLDLMKVVLSLLNNSNPDGTSQTVLLSTLRQWLLSSPHSILLTPCIKAASRCLASLAQMVQIIETCIQVYFTAYTEDKESGPAPISSPPVVAGWDHILAVFQVPELNLDQYIDEALKSGSFLLLYVLVLHQRPLCQSLQDEVKLIEDVLRWTSHAVPTADEEAKMLLWWLELCELWLRQVDFGAPVPLCVNIAQRLVSLLHQLGEDRATTGFFGVIGLGKRSQLTLQFRLAVRSMSAFLSSQILSDTALRLSPSLPHSETAMAKQCRAALSSLRGNKMYALLKDDVENMIGFVHRVDHTAHHMTQLIKELAHMLYPQCDYLTASIKQGRHR